MVDQHKKEIQKNISAIKAEETARIGRFEAVISHQNKEITDLKTSQTNLSKEISNLNSQISDLTAKLKKSESVIAQLK